MIDVFIIMGSTSDWSIMKECCSVLDSFSVSYDKKVVSAHRTPEFMYEFAKTCKAKIIIAGAGGAAHLPGMVASLTPTPVIGVPINATTLNGIDSLLSIVQMPSGIPVACVAINGAKNAGYLALKILSINNPILKKELSKHYENISNKVLLDVLQ